jgi:hypothetical protein
MQLLFVAATHSAALLRKTLSEIVEGVKENDCGGVPTANEMPLDSIVPAADTELFVQGRSKGVEPLGQAISISTVSLLRVVSMLNSMSLDPNAGYKVL